MTRTTRNTRNAAILARLAPTEHDQLRRSGKHLSESDGTIEHAAVESQGSLDSGSAKKGGFVCDSRTANGQKTPNGGKGRTSTTRGNDPLVQVGEFVESYMPGAWGGKATGDDA